MSPLGSTSGSRHRVLFLLGVLIVLGVVYLRLQSLSTVDTLTAERCLELGVAPVTVENREMVSDFSRLRLEDAGTVRTLLFVRDDGTTAIETQMDLAHPERLLIPYTRAMFASYLLAPEQERVLIVGLGGGSMVRFLQVHDPELAIDVVEIDPVVIEVARDYFGTHGSDRVRILERDGFDFLKNTPTVYDVVYMDAFLKPSEDTDASGTPARLKTRAFLEDLKHRVHDAGLIVFNVHELEDLDVIRSVFPQTYVFRLAVPGVVAVGSRVETRIDDAALLELGQQLDLRFRTHFAFADIAKRVAPAGWGSLPAPTAAEPSTADPMASESPQTPPD